MIDISSISISNVNKKEVEIETDNQIKNNNVEKINSEKKFEKNFEKDNSSFFSEFLAEKKIEEKKNVEKKNVEKNIVSKNDVEKTLTENERYKLIALCQLYISEFPDQLDKYKTKKLNKLCDQDLINFKIQIQKEATTSNTLNMLSQHSHKILEFYEYAMCDIMNVNIRGVSKMTQGEEFNQTFKAFLLKYMGDNLINSVEPENKLMFMIISNSAIAHQINAMNERTLKMNATEQKIAVNNEQQQPLNENKIEQINNEFSDL